MAGNKETRICYTNPMQLIALDRRLKEFTSSSFFQIAIAVLAVLIWMMPGNLVWIFVSFYIVLTFFPLFSSDGRGYIPLIFFVTITVSSAVSFQGLPTYLYAIGGTTLVSIILFLVIKKLPFRKGELALPMTLLFLTFLVSYLINLVRVETFDTTGILFIVSLFVILLTYILFNTCLKREDTILYFARTASILALAVSAEILLYQLRYGFRIGDPDINLGWAYTNQSASTILCLSLPFFSMLIARKKPLWGILELFVIYGIISLSADSGLIVLILASIPLVLLSFRPYGKAYPYIVITILALLGLFLLVLMLVEDSFRDRVINALASLNLVSDQNPERSGLFRKGIDAFLAFPAFGSSISVMSDMTKGTVTFCSNTVITTMTMGGVVGLVFFALYEVRLYSSVLRKKNKEKWLFLLFLLVLELIGLMDNTIYNLFVLLFSLLAYSCYQISDRPDDFVVHDAFYRDYAFGEALPSSEY